MKLFEDLLISHVETNAHQGFSFEANQVLIEQLLSNYRIERAEMESIVDAINNVKSARIKNSLWVQLGDFTTNGRFSIQDADREQITPHEELISGFLRSLDCKYWHTLFNRLNISAIKPIYDAPDFEGYLTIYTDRVVNAFNLFECKKLLNIIQNELFDREAQQLKFKSIQSNYSLEFVVQKDGGLKLYRNTSDLYGIFTREISAAIASALYFNDETWYLNSNNDRKREPADLKGIQWMKFKNSKHILSMDKTTADIFIKFYGIEPIQ